MRVYFAKMREIWIPEFIIVLFLFLALIRPWVKVLSAYDGIVWLPFAALLLSAALFPAYGWRPEAVPLALLAALVCASQIPRMISANFSGKTEGRSFSEKNPAVFFGCLALLVFSTALLLVFSPLEKRAPGTGVIRELTFYDEKSGGKFELKVYGEAGSRRPVLVMPSPVLGAAAIDRVSAELNSGGFTVISFSRKNGRAAEIARYFRALAFGKKSAAANEAGRALEDTKKSDLLFILDEIKKNPPLGEGLSLFDIASREDIFLAAYDASASAALLLAADSGFVRSRPEIKGIAAAEPSLWFLYRAEEKPPEVPPPQSNWFMSFWANFGGRLSGMAPKKIAGPAGIPEARIPVLFLVSDRILENSSRSRRRYEALRACFDAAKKPAVLAAAAGAGPCDYAGFASEYPLFSALTRGRKNGPAGGKQFPAGREHAEKETARIISNFAAMLLEDETLKSGRPAPAGRVIPRAGPLHGETHIEARNTTFF